jgi:hypothetical protein
MKYWNTMTNLENEILRVREFKTLLDVTTRGLTETGSTPEETSTVLYTLLGMIEDIDSKMYDNFQSLWDEVRTDSWESDENESDKNSDERWGRIVDDLRKMSVSEG